MRAAPALPMWDVTRNLFNQTVHQRLLADPIVQLVFRDMNKISGIQIQIFFFIGSPLIMVCSFRIMAKRGTVSRLDVGVFSKVESRRWLY